VCTAAEDVCIRALLLVQVLRERTSTEDVRERTSTEDVRIRALLLVQVLRERTSTEDVRERTSTEDVRIRALLLVQVLRERTSTAVGMRLSAAARPHVSTRKQSQVVVFIFKCLFQSLRPYLHQIQPIPRLPSYNQVWNRFSRQLHDVSTYDLKQYPRLTSWLAGMGWSGAETALSGAGQKRLVRGGTETCRVALP